MLLKSHLHISDSVYQQPCTRLPSAGAETAPGPGWSAEEGPQGFWAKLSVLSGTWKWSSSELYSKKSINQSTCDMTKLYMQVQI